MSSNKRHQVIVSPYHARQAPVCKFFLRGQCTKGNACNFAHTGVPRTNNKTTFVQQSGTGAHKNKVQVTITQKTGTKGQRKLADLKKAAYFVVDCSASMRGAPATAAADGLLTVKQRVLSDRDVLSLYTFSNQTKSCFQHQRRGKVNNAGVKALIERMADDGGATALFDAITVAIKDVPKDAKYTDQIKYVVVLTDGQDNRSSTTHEACRQLIAKPGVANLYFILIGVGLSDTYKAHMRALCKPNHAHYIDVGSSSAEIKRAFGTVERKIREYAEIHIHVLESGKVRSNGAYHQVARLLGNVQNAPLALASAPPLSSGVQKHHKQGGQPRLVLLK